jgi:FlaA1/EpsC-like NDP-sugar epimerase
MTARQKIKYVFLVVIDSLRFDCISCEEDKRRLVWDPLEIGMGHGTLLCNYKVMKEIIRSHLISLRKSGLQRFSLYGAGEYAELFIVSLYDCGIEIQCIIDSNAGKQGGSLFGVPIVAPDKIDKTNPHIIPFQNYMQVFIAFDIERFCKVKRRNLCWGFKGKQKRLEDLL